LAGQFRSYTIAHGTQVVNLGQKPHVGRSPG
jgi:hypothetical protein